MTHKHTNISYNNFKITKNYELYNQYIFLNFLYFQLIVFFFAYFILKFIFCILFLNTHNLNQDKIFFYSSKIICFLNCFRHLSFRFDNIAINFKYLSLWPFNCYLYICKDQSIFFNAYLAYIVSGHWLPCLACIFLHTCYACAFAR